MNAIVKLKPSSRSLLLDVAKSALRRSKGNIAIAASQVRAIADRDPAMKQELLEPYYDSAIQRLLRQARPLQWRVALATPARVPETTGIEQLAKANLSDYLNEYRLSTGKILGNARRFDLIQEAQRRREAANVQATHYRFITRLVEFIREGKVVRDQFDNDRLARLMREAEAEKPAL
jgi:hypothetical protein